MCSDTIRSARDVQAVPSSDRYGFNNLDVAIIIMYHGNGIHVVDCPSSLGIGDLRVCDMILR